MPIRPLFRLFCIAALTVVGATASAQLGGNVYVFVTDPQHKPLPNVTLTLSEPEQVVLTNAEGQARFISLTPGRYSLRGELDGYTSYDQPRIDVVGGRNTSLEITMTRRPSEKVADEDAIRRDR